MNDPNDVIQEAIDLLRDQESEARKQLGHGGPRVHARYTLAMPKPTPELPPDDDDDDDVHPLLQAPDNEEWTLTLRKRRLYEAGWRGTVTDWYETKQFLNADPLELSPQVTTRPAGCPDEETLRAQRIAALDAECAALKAEGPPDPDDDDDGYADEYK